MPLRLEDYALLGDCESAALLGRDGSVDWLCWPRFDSGAILAALLGTPEHGRWLLAPIDVQAQSQRLYRAGTVIVETRWETPSGCAVVTDFMPVRNASPHLVRIVSGVSGEVQLRMELVLRFDYGGTVPWVARLPDGRGIRAIAGPDKVVLRSPVPSRGENLRALADFAVRAGDRLAFSLSYTPVSPARSRADRR